MTDSLKAAQAELNDAVIRLAREAEGVQALVAKVMEQARLAALPVKPAHNSDLNIRRNKFLLIDLAMTRAGGNVSQAAKLLGVDRTTVHYLLNQIEQGEQP